MNLNPRSTPATSAWDAWPEQLAELNSATADDYDSEADE